MSIAGPPPAHPGAVGGLFKGAGRAGPRAAHPAPCGSRGRVRPCARVAARGGSGPPALPPSLLRTVAAGVRVRAVPARQPGTTRGREPPAADAACGGLAVRPRYAVVEESAREGAGYGLRRGPACATGPVHDAWGGSGVPGPGVGSGAEGKHAGLTDCGITCGDEAKSCFPVSLCLRQSPA